jgi:hypothetical protein
MGEMAEQVQALPKAAGLRRTVIVAALLVAAAFVCGYIGWTQHVADLWALGLLCTAASPVAGMLLVTRLVRDRRGGRGLRTAGWFVGGAAIGIVLVPAAAILATGGAG